MEQKNYRQHLISDQKKLHYQRRLSAYLKDFENRNCLGAKAVADRIATTQEKLPYVRSDKKPFERFVNSLDYLTRLGSLEELTILEFISYLENEDSLEEAGPKPFEAISLLWQRFVFEAFETLSDQVLGPFVEICKHSRREGKEKLETLIQIINVLYTHTIEDTVQLENFLKKMKGSESPLT